MNRGLFTLFCCMTLTSSIAQNTDKLVIYQVYTRLFGNLNTTNQWNGTLKQNGSGKFNDINTAALSSLKSFGVTHVWYTGIIEHATQTDYSAYGIQPDHPALVKGKGGSPYAIKDYYDVDPDLAVSVPDRMKEFQSLVDRSHQAGLKVLIDFVPNHVARQYHSDAKPAGVEDFGKSDDLNQAFHPQNNFYYLPGQALVPPAPPVPVESFQKPYQELPAKATGNDVFSATPSVNDWYEAVKLNYGVDYLQGRKGHFDPIPDTWKKMVHILSYWAAKGVDGFRCDMAEMVPVEFWAWAIPQVKKAYPNTLFIAEIYNPQAYKTYLDIGQFDYLYDKVGLYDALRRLMEGHGHTHDITRVWQQESGDFGHRMLRFLENHDEQRIASQQFAENPWRGIPAMFLSATLHGGPLMYYFGQEYGVKPTQSEGFSGEDGRTTMFDYWGVPEFQAWVNNHQYDGGKLTEEQKALYAAYRQINAFVLNSPAIQKGAFFDLQYLQNPLQYRSDRVYSYLRYLDGEQYLLIVNFSAYETLTTQIRLPSGVLKKTKDAAQLNWLTSNRKENISWEELTRNGVSASLPPNSYHIIQIH